MIQAILDHVQIIIYCKRHTLRCKRKPTWVYYIIHNMIYYQASEETEQANTYDQLVRQLVTNEEKYISHLNLLLKVFQEPFTKRPDLFPPEVMCICTD